MLRGVPLKDLRDELEAILLAYDAMRGVSSRHIFPACWRLLEACTTALATVEPGQIPLRLVRTEPEEPDRR